MLQTLVYAQTVVESGNDALELSSANITSTAFYTNSVAFPLGCDRLGAVFLYNLQSLLHLVLVVEIHLDMNAVGAHIVEQRLQLVESNPACKDALSALQNCVVKVVPLRRATLRFAHSRSPLYGVKFLNLKQCRNVAHSPHAVEMIERVVNLLALLAYERLHKLAVVLLAEHRRDVALKFAHLARSPRREVAERHFVALAYDVVKFVEHLEIHIVDALNLVEQDVGLRDGVKQHGVRSLHRRQNIETFHQVGHSDVVVAFSLRLYLLEQLFVQKIVRMIRIKLKIILEIRVGMNPDGIFATLEHRTENGSHRARTELSVCHRKNVGFQTAVCNVPVEIIGTPVGIEPLLVQVLWCRRHGHVGMRLHSLLKVLPHVQHYALVVPPVDIVLLCLFKIFFPSHKIGVFSVRTSRQLRCSYPCRRYTPHRPYTSEFQHPCAQIQASCREALRPFLATSPRCTLRG